MHSYPNRLIITITGPSGAGKDTILKEIVRNDPQVTFFPTATTRQKREHETHGVDYYFLSHEDFLEKLENGDFLEHNAAYHGNMYGTLRNVVEDLLSKGYDVASDLNWVGVEQIQEKAADNIVKLLVMPPSYETLEQRMRERRKQTREDSNTIAKRLEKIKVDMQYKDEPNYIFTNDDMQGSTLNDYDYVIVNDNLNESVSQALAFLAEQRRKRAAVKTG